MKSSQIPSVETIDPEQMCRNQVRAIAKSKRREQDVLDAFAIGLNRQQVADRLGISVKTVDMYKTNLLAVCRNAWNLPLNEKLDYHFLYTKFTETERVSKEGMQSMTQDEHGPTIEMLLQSQTRGLPIQKRVCCEQVIARASKSELRVLKEFAEGLTPQQVAKKLWISLHTVHSHKTKLFALCRSAWNLSCDAQLDYHFLNENFAGFSSHAKQETPDTIR